MFVEKLGIKKVQAQSCVQKGQPSCELVTDEDIIADLLDS